MFMGSRLALDHYIYTPSLLLYEVRSSVLQVLSLVHVNNQLIDDFVHYQELSFSSRNEDF